MPTARSTALRTGPYPARVARRRQPPWVLAVLGLALAIAVTLFWADRAGWRELTHGPSQWWRVVASLSGMWVSLAGMIGLVLAARLRWMERSVGLDRLLNWHRVAGDTLGVLLAVHIVSGVMAEKTLRGGLKNTVIDLSGREPYMAMALIGSIIIGVVVVCSLRQVRHRMAYETWYFLHLTVYFGLALSLPHQLTLGSSIAGDLKIQVMWVVVSAAFYATALFGRWGKVLAAVARPLRVSDIRRETPTSVSLMLSGSRLRQFGGEPGQFVMLRALKPGLWWKANPFSLSAAPNGMYIRITVKDRGDASSGFQSLRLGDRVAVEGPYGTISPQLFAGKRPVLIAGGVGVTPVCALLQGLPARSKPVVLLRARRLEDIPHFEEITSLTAQLGGKVHTLTGSTDSISGRRPFSGDALRRLLGGGYGCSALVCGPPSLLYAARSGLRQAGLHRSDIHIEQPWW